MAGRKTKLTPKLIDEIVDLVSRGAVDHVVCAIVGINRSTFKRWKAKARADDADPLFSEFYERYERACGFRVLSWIQSLERKKEFKWLLQHDPSTKEDWCDVKTVKRETIVKITKQDVEAYIAKIDWYRNYLREAQKEDD